ASRDFAPGKNQNTLRDQDVEKIIDTLENRTVIDKYSYLATLDEIQENDYNLNIPRYVDTFEEEEEIDLMAVQSERTAIESEIAQLNEQMAGYLKELGYVA
ncbi:N-6 DNA methylase, partial [Marinobacter sp.]|uniref:N-6 DNA methylase n=1 Tax=Marinobacter sp. TaxID=50741 RepID=UPI003A92DA88